MSDQLVPTAAEISNMAHNLADAYHVEKERRNDMERTLIETSKALDDANTKLAWLTKELGNVGLLREQLHKVTHEREDAIKEYHRCMAQTYQWRKWHQEYSAGLASLFANLLCSRSNVLECIQNLYSMIADAKLPPSPEEYQESIHSDGPASDLSSRPQ